MAAPTPDVATTCADFLLSEPGPLYALLDAARDPAVLGFITEYGLEAHCLYAGLDPELTDFAPYLVSLTADQTRALVKRAWGESWGVFLRSDADADAEALRRHFRKFLMVQIEGGEEVYFRFYDPRVLRVFLPTCTASEWTEFFGPVETFLVEDGGGDVLVLESVSVGATSTQYLGGPPSE